MTRRENLLWLASPLLATVGAQRLAAQTRTADIIVYGATSSGVAAAIQARRMGKTVLLLNPDKHVGGLTTGGLGWTDLGHTQILGGISMEFYRRVKDKYDPAEMWRWQPRADYYNHPSHARRRTETTMWTFEPKVASAVYRDMMREHSIEPILGARLDLRSGRGVRKQGTRITAIVMEDGKEYHGKMFIDTTYEGDLLTKAGVSYATGREANAKYNEDYNGVQANWKHRHQFPDGCHVDPYVKAGNKTSGLLPIIDPTGPGKEGEGDHRVQAYCYRLCMTTAKGNMVTIEKPKGYDPIDHELLLRYAESGFYHEPPTKWDGIPNAKTDTNNHGAVSTDYMGANWEYPDGDYGLRQRIIERHQVYTKGYLWTLQNHDRVPNPIRNWYRQWGLPKDEFTDNEHFPAQLYVRESRRLLAPVVMTQHHIEGRELAKDSVGMGAYGMDSHNVQRYVTKDGYVRNEGNVQKGGFKPYPISYRSIVPRKEECTNLLVPVCLAASHIAYGSIRMEPVFMGTGQSAATAACMSIDGNNDLLDLSYSALEKKLLADKQSLQLVQG